MSNQQKISYSSNNSSCSEFNLKNNNLCGTNFKSLDKYDKNEISFNKNYENMIKNDEIMMNNNLYQREMLYKEYNDMNLKKNLTRNKSEYNSKRNNIRSNSNKINIATNNYFPYTNNIRIGNKIQKTKNLENNNKKNKTNDNMKQLIRNTNKKSLDKNSNETNINFNKFLRPQSSKQPNKKKLNNENNLFVDRNKNPQDCKTLKLQMFNINDTFINIIYLLDTTYSMKKYKDIVYSLKDINDKLKSEFKNIQFGFVLYKDFDDEPLSLKLNQSHIKVYPPSKEGFINDEINFIGGYDYAEDWANAYYEISQLELGNNENIIIHFCDSGAHGKRFSDYDYKNKQENLLIQALKFCAEKNFKIIGLLYNEFARKSFLACAKIYKGYYNLVDLTLDDMTKENNFYNKISQNINYALENKKNMTFLDDYSQIRGFEKDFYWKKTMVNMMKLKNIKNKYYNNFNYIFLPILNGSDINEIKKFVKSNTTPYQDPKTANYDNNNYSIKTGLKQGNIGDCYLISPIICLIYNKIPLTEYIFPETDYDQNTESIEMYIYENGVRKLITFKNTYATNNDYFIFSSPLNNAFFGISIEKGYAVNNSDKKTIKSGFEKIGKGGFSFNVFNSLFGTESETFSKSKNIIQKDELKNKIKKYLDFNGLICFGVYFNISNSGHAFSVIGYKEYQNGEFYIEILNPWHKGKYLENNIKKNDIYNISSKEIKSLFNSERRGKNIYEEEFKDNQEIYNIFNNYEKTGFLTMKLDTFFNWFETICFCDPMLGYYESILEINKGEENIIYFKITKETKLKAFLLESEKVISDLNEQMEFFQIQKKVDNPTRYCIYLEKDNNSKNNINKRNKNFKNLIYEKLIPGDYMIEIYPAKIEKNLYLKFQANDIIIYDKKRKFDIDNGGMGKYNCNCLDKYLGFEECYFCQIYGAYQLIDKIVKSLIELISYYHNYSYNNNNLIKIEIYNDLLPVYSENNISCISYSHLYYHYMSTKFGFIVLIINKFNFNWECKSRIEYNKNTQLFSVFFKFGTFKITKELIAYDYKNSKFKNILTHLGYNETSFNLLDIDSFIKIRDEKIKCELNKDIEGQKLEQIKPQYILEVENLELIKNQQTTEQQKLEQIKSQYIFEVKNLELIKNQLTTEQQKLENLRNTLRSEQQDLDRIKYLKISEQQILDKIKIEQEKYKKFNCFEYMLMNLEESKINFINIGGSSCYQSSTLQGFVHLIYPKAIRKLNEEKIKKGELIIQCLDQLKNNIKFNDMVIDILKDINIKENERKINSSNTNKNYEAKKIFDEFPPENGQSQGLLNEYDCHKLHERLIYGGKIIDSYSSINDNVLDLKDTFAKTIEINKRTIISDVLKLKIENDKKTYANLVLKLNEKDLKDSDLNILKLIKNCELLKNDSNNSSHKKIIEISDIIYIIIDRVDQSKGIPKKFIIAEKLYFDKSSQNFKENCSSNYLLYELQFIIYHSSCDLWGGHYFAYQKIKGDWYYFNDIDSDYAQKTNPPLNDTNEYSNFPVIIYYVLNK